jgi:malonate-semialdehyde dehydrogenase (acetylating)/methylmalonate-semialdehyde dehydrogenase
VDTYDEAQDLINTNRMATAPPSSPTTAARRAQNEVEVDGRHQRAHPGADGLLQLRRLESLPVRRQPRSGTGVHNFTARQGVTSRWLDPSHGGIELGFPQGT